jgi:hypothetical protein
MVARL